MSGIYVIFEGNDGAGKTSTMIAVGKALEGKLDVQLTHHPGSTPLGAHIRKLVKFPKQIDSQIQVDDMSRQLLYMVDTVSFIKSLLEPALEKGQSVFADRSSFISAIAYGLADGLNIEDINQLYQLVYPPKANRLYILQCPWEVAKDRVRVSRTAGYDGGKPGELDHYDQKPDGHFAKVQAVYDNLITGPVEQTILVSHCVALENVTYVDATQPLGEVVDFIVADLEALM